MTDPLPPEVAAAVREAFGDVPATDITKMGGGLSGALIYSVKVDDKAFVVRLAHLERARTEHDPGRAVREFACMKIASERGVAPKVHFMDPARGIVVMEKIETAASPAPRRERLERTAKTLRHLHDGPAFPMGASISNLFHTLDAGLRAQNKGGLPESAARTIDDLTSITTRFATVAPCHKDLNPNNILEAEDRTYFVDWEGACAGDPFFDVAEFGVFGCATPEERAAFVEMYLGHAPSREEVARATLGRVMALGFYGAAFWYVTILQGRGAMRGEAPALSEVLGKMAEIRERVAPEMVSAALLREMEWEAAAAEYEEAKRVLAG